jgi:hypothetical protein
VVTLLGIQSKYNTKTRTKRLHSALIQTTAFVMHNTGDQSSEKTELPAHSPPCWWWPRLECHAAGPWTRAALRVRSHCRFVLPSIYSIP